MLIDFNASVATPERFDRLVAQFRPLLCNTAIQAGWRSANNQPADQIDDVIQTAITAVYARGPWRTMPAATLIEYLKRAVVNGTSNHLKSQRRQRLGKKRLAREAGVDARGSRVRAPRPFSEGLHPQPDIHKMDEPIHSPVLDHTALSVNAEEDCRLTGLSVRQALDKLPVEQKEILHLLFYDGCSLQEAAKSLGLSCPTARKRRDKALAALRVLLNA